MKDEMDKDLGGAVSQEEEAAKAFAGMSAAKKVAWTSALLLDALIPKPASRARRSASARRVYPAGYARDTRRALALRPI